ncbi:aminoacyl-tRNA hydrolase [Alkalihalobacillus hemicellulosilyticus]|uniref:Peptidyl-tRNA hydrolase n=1 Tax=Halalkalibacter hemicellulosilyticusJCM 9152 TaxID=1236971 RepID=W4QJC7_9BACI|nr:aminoacyl-tRNA hydrolase [Halalkalibacter hemicellulosilyticus]GAE31748.1 peptidyl-tRNA hydrolase [Halalkalibacter hemicellulosilyticusJCM 9152]
MKLIVGLGNPGEKYRGTRHNVGFDCIDYCAKELGIELNQLKFKSLYGKGLVNGEQVILMKPLTYMNLSGEAIRMIRDYYKLSIEDLVVIYDDMDLPPGKIRLRQKGSAGGHNGIKSTIQQLGTNEFNRIRIGINRPEPGQSIVNYVLGSYKPEEKEDVSNAVKQAAKAVEAWTEIPFIQVMNRFN